MKTKVVIIILVVACVGLAIALFTIKNQADEQHKTDVHQTEEFSNQVASASKQLGELGQVNLTLSNDLASSQQQLASSADQMSQLSNKLTAATATLAETRSSLGDAQQTITNLNSRISDLEAQNKSLDEQAKSYSNQLVQLTIQIEETKTKLAVALTNVGYLQTELQKQLAAKAELEHKFNDLDELRAQVKKIKDEMFVARRMELMKYDTSNKKGGELLMSRNLPVPPSSSHRVAGSTYDLNVEVGSDGSVKVIPPAGNTNSPARQ